MWYILLCISTYILTFAAVLLTINTTLMKQKPISLKLDFDAQAFLEREVAFTSQPRNRVINRAIILYCNLARLQRDHTIGTVSDKQFNQEVQRLLSIITTVWS